MIKDFTKIKMKLLSEKQTQTNQSALYQKISYCEGDDKALQLPKKLFVFGGFK